MAHFGFRKSPTGDWSTVTVITTGDMTYFDQTLSKCINGDEGGTWAPSSPIVIGGAGVAFDIGGHAHVLSGGELEVDAGGTLLIDPGATFSFPKRLVAQLTTQWIGGSTWTNTGSFSGGALQVIAAIDAAANGIIAGDEIHYEVDYTALLFPSTQAWLRLSGGEDSGYFTGGVEAGGSTGLTGTNLGGQKIIGPHYYTAGDLTLPTYAPITQAAKYIYTASGPNIYLALSAKVQQYDSSTVSQVSVDQTLAALGDAVFSYRAMVWRP